MMPERLTLVDIAHMHFDDRLFEREQGVKNGNRCVSQPGAVDQQAIGFQPCRLDPVDQLAFVVRLPEVQADTKAFRMLAAAGFDLRKAFRSIGSLVSSP